MIKYVKDNQPEKVMMVTECSMSDNVQVDNPNVKFIRPCNLCPHMKRITLGGEPLSDFPEGQESGYVKVLFEKDPESNTSSNQKDSFLMRSYTIRSYRASSQELDLDFVLHGDTGHTSRWATGAKAGDRISVAGPGPKKLADEDADWYLFVGDLTSLPAISVNLEQLDRAAKGFALLEVISPDDEIQIDAPDNIEIQWILNSVQPGQPLGCTLFSEGQIAAFKGQIV